MGAPKQQKEFMKRSYLKRCGKIGRINLAANKILKDKYRKEGIIECEMCGSDWGLTFAHRRKRWYYKDKPELLSDMNETRLLCLTCHQKIEYNKKLTEEVFKGLRGEKVV
jgi:hypothetical protein